MGIDMFKAFDTTRIFVCCVDSSVTQELIDKLEYSFIHAIDRKYLLNSLGGGNSLEFIHSDGKLGYGRNQPGIPRKSHYAGIIKLYRTSTHTGAVKSP